MLKFELSSKINFLFDFLYVLSLYVLSLFFERIECILGLLSIEFFELLLKINILSFCLLFMVLLLKLNALFFILLILFLEFLLLEGIIEIFIFLLMAVFPFLRLLIILFLLNSLEFSLSSFFFGGPFFF